MLQKLLHPLIPSQVVSLALCIGCQGHRLCMGRRRPGELYTKSFLSPWAAAVLLLLQAAAFSRAGDWDNNRQLHTRQTDAVLWGPGAGKAEVRSTLPMALHKGAITQCPQRITSSPGLHHSPVQRKSKYSQKGKGDSECLFSHACTKSRERVCSRARGPQRSPCPWDTSAVVSGAALVSPVGNG